jgi:hypothetical protein
VFRMPDTAPYMAMDTLRRYRPRRFIATSRRVMLGRDIRGSVDIITLWERAMRGARGIGLVRHMRAQRGSVLDITAAVIIADTGGARLFVGVPGAPSLTGRE